MMSYEHLRINNYDITIKNLNYLCIYNYFYYQLPRITYISAIKSRCKCIKFYFTRSKQKPEIIIISLAEDIFATSRLTRKP